MRLIFKILFSRTYRFFDAYLNTKYKAIYRHAISNYIKLDSATSVKLRMKASQFLVFYGHAEESKPPLEDHASNSDKS